VKEIQIAGVGQNQGEGLKKKKATRQEDVGENHVVSYGSRPREKGEPRSLPRKGGVLNGKSKEKRERNRTPRKMAEEASRGIST